MHTLFVFNSMVKGDGIYGNKVTAKDIKIFKKLILLDKELPNYVIKIWNSFRNKKERIKINMYYMYKYYSSFLSYFVSSKIKNLLLLDEILKIFPSLVQVECEETDCIGNTLDSGIISSEFILGLKDFLAKNHQNKSNKLKKIIIKTDKKIKTRKLYKKSFGEFGWKIEKDKKKVVLGLIE